MQPVSPDIFRAYDIRGLVGSELNESSVAQIAKGFATMLLQRGGKRMVLGRDCRSSSLLFRKVFSEAARGCGVDVVDVGEVATPLTYYAAEALEGIDGLAMITGSHNPPEYNGFKVGIGHMLHSEEIQVLRRIVEAGDFPSGAGSLEELDLRERYLQAAQASLRMGPRKLRVVIDGGNGMSGPVALPLYEALGATVSGIYLEPDGTFPNHHPDPTVEENLVELRERVLAEGADLGIAFDGDGDRLGVIDDKGQILWGDQLMILYARAVLAEEPGATIVGEVKCSQTMYDEIERHGGVPVMWKAGHSLIKAKMKETEAALGGEMSGHIFFQNRWFGFDDAAYAGARLLEILSHEQRPLSALLADVPKTFSSPEIRREAGSEARKFALVEAATEAFRSEGYEVNEVDGARVAFQEGWGLVRASNTQPILVLRFEASSPEGLRRIEQRFDETLSRISGA